MEKDENIVTFEDDEGNVFKLEIVDYFNYNGNDYVILADSADMDDEDCDCEDGECDCENEDCDCEHDHEAVDVYVMQVVPVDDENEEFVPLPEDIEDEVLAFADRYLSGELDGMLEDDEDEEYDEDEDEEDEE